MNLPMFERRVAGRVLLAGAIAFAALLPCAHSAIAALFRAPFIPVDAAGDPSALALADLNEDGETDVVVAHYGTGTVSVFLREGGVLGARRDFDAPLFIEHFAIVDVDGDDRLDVVTGGRGSPGVSILFGDGSGDLVRRADTRFGAIADMAVGELTGDGVPDLAIVSRGTFATVSIIPGLGDGTFGGASAVPTVSTQSPSTAESVAISDLDGDGHQDLLFGERHAGLRSVEIRLGRGDGTFDDGGAYGGPTKPLLIRDLNEDGHPDLVSGATVRFNDGTGAFGGPLTLPVTAAVSFVTTGDINRDGKVDLALGPNPIFVFYGDGAGSFSPPINVPIANSCAHAVIADVTGDGRPDLVTADPADQAIAVLVHHRDGTFGGGGFTGKTGLAPVAIAAGDFDGDGILDLATVGRDADRVSVMRGAGDGTFLPKLESVCSEAPAAIAAGDVTGDGIMDLVLPVPGLNQISVSHGLGDGTFAWRKAHRSGARPIAVALADLNLDGRIDMVVANQGASSVSVFLGMPDGAFALKRDFPTGATPNAVAIARLNADPIPDIVVATGGQVTASVLLGNGDGTFRPRVDVGQGGGMAVATADLDYDGIEDLLLLTADHKVEVFPGIGGGAFGSGHVIDVAPGASAIAASDLTADGRADLIIARGAQGSVSVRIGTGDGYFGEPLLYGVGLQPSAIVARDLDSNGRPELAVANTFSGTVTVLQNRGAWPLAVTSGPDVGLALGLAFPNPAHDQVTIPFTLATASNVDIRIFDVRGRVVGRVTQRHVTPGRHVVQWEAQSRVGSIPPGVYFYQLSVAGRRVVRTFVLR